MKKKYGLVGSWTENKLRFIQKYLVAYTNVFRYQSWARDVGFIDMFAGPGECVSKSSGKKVDGSPILALKNTPPFSFFIFNDYNKKNIEKLDVYRKIYFPNSKIHLSNDDANVFVDSIKDLVGEKVPIFVFLDPQALDLNYSTIEKLANEYKHIDFLINFPVGQILRVATAFKCNECKGKQCDKCPNKIYGHDNWRQLLDEYLANKISFKGYCTQSLSLYMQKLEELGFSWTVKHVTNSKNSKMYDLIFASRFFTANKIMRDVMFGDELQTTLLPINVTDIKVLVRQRFSSDKSVSTQTVSNSILTGDNTYREKDIQDALRELESEEKLKRDIPLMNKRKKRFDPGVTFKVC